MVIGCLGFGQIWSKLYQRVRNVFAKLYQLLSECPGFTAHKNWSHGSSRFSGINAFYCALYFIHVAVVLVPFSLPPWMTVLQFPVRG